jgi:hypothetical protein
MPAGLHPADSLNHFAPDLGIPPDSFRSGSALAENRDRLLTTDIARQFLADKAVAPLLSDEHFSVDGTLIQAWASISLNVQHEASQMKSFQPREAATDAEPPAGDDAASGQDSGASAPEPAGGDGEGSNQDGGAPAAEQPAASRNAEVDFHGQKRSNETHVSRTDPQARLYLKGPGKAASASCRSPVEMPRSYSTGSSASRLLVRRA